MTAIIRALCPAILLLAAVTAFAGSAYADTPPCPDDGKSRPACTKEIRVWNNTPDTIYVVVQGSIQKTDALNCPLNGKGGGDVWLQAALGDSSKCYTVSHDYYAFINPKTGIPSKGFASINVPWWSKRAPGAPDLYIDWWRGGRIIIFDDQTALNDSYAKLKANPQVAFAPKTPVVSCRNVTNNKCLTHELQIFEVNPKAAISAHTPFQLNEYTFADVSIVSPDGKTGGKFIGFNQNYNVSNVDQVYLPIAIEPVRQPADIGYMGTTMPVDKFKEQLKAFTGADVNPTNPTKWPIYNNPLVNGKPFYPKAGIRVPSTLAVFNFYMNPSIFKVGNQDVPEIVPAKPPQLISDIMTQWTACTTTGKDCPQANFYQEIDDAFAANYAAYIANKSCKPPPFLQPVKGSNPPAPPLFAYLRFIHGWVPFNTGCAGAVPELPTADQPPAGSRAPVDYIDVQYNFQIPTLQEKQWFNPYTQFIHGEVAQGGLSASAYAFSIDDHASFQNNSGGSLPGGLIVAVGGENGLLNKTQMPPPVPAFYKYFNFSVALGGASPGGALWDKYGVCKDTADTRFPPVSSGVGYIMGVDPATRAITPSKPCTVTLMDNKNRKYQITVLKAKAPPEPIWPPFSPSAGKNFDPNVVKCPAVTGVVAPDKWCDFTNEVAKPATPPNAPTYSLSTRGPL